MKKAIFKPRALSAEFILRFLFNYFLYGYLCILGILLCVGIFLPWFLMTAFPFNCAAFLLLLAALPLFAQLWGICAGVRTKYRFYKISVYRLKTRGFKEDYFKYEIYEPCFRLIVRDLCKRNGFFPEYKEMCCRLLKKGMRAGLAKERALRNFAAGRNLDLQQVLENTIQSEN